MARINERGEKIRQFILANVENHPQDIVALTAQEFSITRQAVNKHIQKLIIQQAIVTEGSTKDRSYCLNILFEWIRDYELNNQLQEDIVWASDVKPLLADLPENIRDIWYYGFTEMLNNAIDHSSGTRVIIGVQKTAIYTTISIDDNGEGIFRKIQRALQLYDERQAVLELAKGKLTTDPENHSGQGIFFTSRMFDRFTILSGSVYFSHVFDRPEDWILEMEEGLQTPGTGVTMQLNNNTSRTSKEVFDRFSSGDDYAFTKTVVPVRLAQYGDEKLVSRSQAKRLLARVDRFKIVVFDFVGVEAIGQAFADEVFRVFKKQHPEIEVVDLNANRDVAQMISRAKSDL